MFLSDMDLLLHIDIDKLPEPIDYRQSILLTGSCFTEHIGSSLEQHKFKVLQNPNGILFGPDSVCRSLESYTGSSKLEEQDLFYLNETWHSWMHHSRFSSTQKDEALSLMNASREKAAQFLKKADWLIITLGSAFTYRLTHEAQLASSNIGDAVANCHRAPASWFTKELMETAGIVQLLKNCLEKLHGFNPNLKFLFTISPVRHIRDGVVENNRSKSRLIEAVHQVVADNNRSYYFPAYELVIDVLRDYRFYDIDLVHPNYAATKYVFEKFTESCISDSSRQLMEDVRKIVIARKHRPFQPDTKAHTDFLATHHQKAQLLQEKNPFLDLDEEIRYFSRSHSTEV